MATITVGCRLPQGLHIDWPPRDTAGAKSRRVTLKGANADAPEGVLVPNGAGSRVGLTRGVDKEWFEAWLKAHEDFEPVKRGLIFASDKEASVQAQAKELRTEPTGFDGIDPNALPAGIETAKAD